MLAAASAFWPCTRSREAVARAQWPSAPGDTRRPGWGGCTATTKAAPRRCGIGARGAAPPLPGDPGRARCSGLRCSARGGRAARRRRRPEAALDAQAAGGFVRARFARPCCRETIRAALHRLGLSWKKAKKLLGRADPARREAFIAWLRPGLGGAPHHRDP